ncbi:MAG: hypothetical protein PHI29_10970 [Gallionella sp.]|nr:hypothetical protein [Gallionella sp.]
MSDFRIQSAMVLFRLEQALGNVVIERNPEIDEQIHDIAESISERVSLKRPSLTISTTAELVAETYIEDLFQLALRISRNTSDYRQWLALKELCSALSLFLIRNAIAHPNRTFPKCYWFRLASIASDPLMQQLGLGSVTATLELALEGKITPPPDEWMNLPEWLVPNNLPKNSDFEITGLIGRPKESKDLYKYLQNPRISCISVVAPGGVGKTALAIDVLDKACKTPEFHQIFDAVIFISLKLEKLTASGIVKLDAPTTINEIELQLAKTIPAIFGDDEVDYSFADVVDKFSSSKLLLFVDNLETILRDHPESFEEFQINLPIQWRMLVTSRVTTNSATCLPIGPLSVQTAKHLAKIYATRRNASDLLQDATVDKIVVLTHCNPLAIRLGVDSYILGSTLDDSVVCASNDVLNFSYKNLLEVLSRESVCVLECLFLQDPQTRIELVENIGSTIDLVAKGVYELARTSLITRDSGQQQELYSLYPAIRDLLLIIPRDISLRSEIQERILRRRDVTAGAEQLQTHLGKHHEDFVPLDLPEVVKNVLYETNRVIGKKGKLSTPEDALKLLNRLRELRSAYENLSVIWRYTAKISVRLGDNLTAVSDLRRAIEIEPKDISALKMLGRMGHNMHDYNLSFDSYSRIKDLSGWDNSITDMQNARYCCSGYHLAQLYLGKYDDILRETQDWQENEGFRDIRGAFRARAWKRSIENSSDITKNAYALNKSATILDELSKQYGYPDLMRGVYQEVLEEIKDTARMGNFAECKQADYLLDFVARNIGNAYRDEGTELQVTLEIVRALNIVPLSNNPFRGSEWSEFLRRRGGRVFVDEDIKNSFQDAGYILVRIYHIPKANSPFVFAKDKLGSQFYIHFSDASGLPWQEWVRLKDGDEMAIKAEQVSVGQKAARATEAIALPGE